MSEPHGWDHEAQVARIYEANRAEDTASSELPQIAPKPHSDRVISRTLDEVKPSRVLWLCPDYLPLGKLVIAEGPPGIGKSMLFASEVPALLTTGRPFPFSASGHFPGPVHVIVATSEDDLADTVRPRFEAAGGDLERFHTLEGVPTSSGPQPFNISDHIERLRDAIRSFAARYVALDALFSFLDQSTDPSNNAQIRRAIEPLARLARHEACTIVGVRHFVKGGRGSATDRGLGGISLIGVARQALAVGLDPTDPTKTRRVLAVAKSNLGRRPPSITFTIDVREDSDTATIVWGQRIQLHADDLVGAPEGAEDRADRREVGEHLRAFLALHGEVATLVGDCLADLKAAGLMRPSRTLSRIRNEFGIEHMWSRAFRPQHYWALPGQEIPSPATLEGASADPPGATALNRDDVTSAPSPATTGDVAELDPTVDQDR